MKSHDFLGIKDEKEVRGLKKKVDLLNEKNRTLEIRNQKDQQDLERIKNEKSELTKSLTRYQERIDKGTYRIIRSLTRLPLKPLLKTNFTFSS